VSAVWNLAYDAGMGLGAAGFGVLAVRTGYPAAFALAAAVPPAVLTVASARRPHLGFANAGCQGGAGVLFLDSFNL
jgi:hypothetical protein